MHNIRSNAEKKEGTGLYPRNVDKRVYERASDDYGSFNDRNVDEHCTSRK